MTEFIIYYFKCEDAKARSHKEFKLCVFPSLRPGVQNINRFLWHVYKSTGFCKIANLFFHVFLLN